MDILETSISPSDPQFLANQKHNRGLAHTLRERLAATARALAAHFEKSLHIPVDDLREMVVSGLALPGPTWDAPHPPLVRSSRRAPTAGR